RPEHLSVHLVGSGDLTRERTEDLADGPGQSTGSTGVVIGQSFYGHDALVRVRLDGDVQVSVRVHGSDRFTVGDVVRVRAEAPVTTYPAPGRVGPAAR
ncbi:MAG: TOBE domain-containing protein, partial [Humibacillus sp.]|nr:TOBE domain-containing protein [Humibacillus sp.]